MDEKNENQTALPTGQVSTEPEILKFENIAKSAEANVQTEAAAQVQGPKRGRGRPRKTPPAGSSVSPQGANQGAAPDSASVPTAPPEMNLKPVLKEAIKAPFEVAAIRTGIPELRVTDEEADAPASCADQLVNLYLPTIAQQDPKTVMLYSFLFLMVTLGGQKYLIYSQKIAEKSQKQNSPAPPPSEPTSPLPGPSSEGGDFTSQFARKFAGASIQ